MRVIIGSNQHLRKMNEAKNKNNRLGGGRRRIDSFSESAKNYDYDFALWINSDGGYIPPPTRLLSPQRYIERRPHDAAKRTSRRRTKLGLSLVTYIAYTTRSVPSTILVSCRSAAAHELPLGFHCSSKEGWILFGSMIRKQFSCLPISVIASWRRFRYYNLVHTPDRRACGSYVSPRGLELFGHCSLGILRPFFSWTIQKKTRDRPLLKVTCPNGTSKIIGPFFSASSTHGWLQKWEFAILGSWRHIRQSVSPNLKRK